MKIKYIFLFGVVAAFSSCSTVYRSGQTPDDVYYSPAPEQSSYVNAITDQDKDSYSYRNDEESQIRSGIQNPIYRTPLTFDLGYGLGYSPYGYNPYAFNNYSSMFGYNPYSYGYNPYGFNKGLYSPYGYNSYGYSGLSFYSNPYSPYSYYNSPYSGYYSPIYSHLVGNINTNRGVRRYNLNPYNNGTTTTATPGSVGVRGNIETTQPSTSAPVRRTTGVGNVIRRVFKPSNNNTNSNTNRNTRRTYNNSNNNRSNNTRVQAPRRTFNNNTPSVSTPSSSRSSSSNSSAPVRSFRR